MLRKLPPLFLVLLLAVSLLPIPNLTQAQSIILLTFAVIGVGEGEAGEILWVHSKPASQEGRTFQAWVTLQNAARSGSSCIQTIQVPVTPFPGLNIFTLYWENGSVFINVNDSLVIEDLEAGCFDDTRRVNIQIQFPGSASSESNYGEESVELNEPRTGLPNRIQYQAVYDRATGQTVASSVVDRPGQSRWYKFAVEPSAP